MSFVERANTVRKRIPFAYWLVYDFAVAPVMVYALSKTWWALLPFAMFLVAIFFDVNEAFVKWARRQ